MELLWVTENYYPNKGGMAQSCERIVEGLRAAGVVVNVLHFSHRHFRFHVEHQHQGLYIAVPSEENYPHNLQLGFSLIESQTLNIDGIVAFGGLLPILSAPIYAAWLQKPFAVCIRGNDMDVSVFHAQRQAYWLHALNQSKVIITNSTTKALRINLLLQAEKAFFIPNGIEADWQATTLDKEKSFQYKQKYPDKQIIGLFGQLKQKKGLAFFVECLIASGLENHFHLLMIGEMEEKVKEGLGSTTLSYEVLPFINRYALIPYFLACEWIAIPSFYDGMPNVLLEAMALGVPVIASSVDGMKDVIQHGDDGLLFQNLNSADCIHQLMTIYQMPTEEYQQIAHNAQKKALTHYLVHNEVQQFIKILSEYFKPKI